MAQEIFKTIVGFENYQVSNLGRVYNTKTHRYLKGGKGKNGYIRVTIYDNFGKKAYKNIHRLVAEAFLPNPEGLKCVNHIDEDKTNNVVDNLEWCNRSQNNKHAFTIGLRSYDELSRMAKMPKRKSRKITFSDAEEIRKIVGKTDKEIAEIYGISRGSVWQIRKGITYARA